MKNTHPAKLRVGIVGVGWFAQTYHVPNLRKTARAEVAAVSRRNPERLARAAEALGVERTYTDWRQMLEEMDLDAVIVCTAHNAHFEPALAALGRGLHVLVEKPLALTPQEAWAMVKAEAESPGTLMVGYNSRCRRIWQSVRRTLLQGKIGRVRQMNLSFCTNFRWLWEPDVLPPDWRERLQGAAHEGFLKEWQAAGYWRSEPSLCGGGAFADAGSHAADLALWLSGAPATEVYAVGEEAGLPVDCFLGIQSRLANGVLLSLQFTAGVPGDMRSRLTVFGDGGVLTSRFKGLGEMAADDIWTERDGERETINEEGVNLTTDEAFLETVLDGKPNPAPAVDGARAVAFTEAVYRSLNKRAVVKVADG
jgi:predicted dehydrogenase